MIVQLRPREPTIIEYIVWFWAATMWLEELRQVGHDVVNFQTAWLFRLICDDRYMQLRTYVGMKSRFHGLETA